MQKCMQKLLQRELNNPFCQKNIFQKVVVFLLRSTWIRVKNIPSHQLRLCRGQTGRLMRFLHEKPARKTKPYVKLLSCRTPHRHRRVLYSASMTSGTERSFLYPALPENGEMEVMERLRYSQTGSPNSGCFHRRGLCSTSWPLW
jgi:hypothetical protein